MSRWKATERAIATLLGGERVPVPGRQRGSAPDIEHEKYSVEVKDRKKLPNWLHDSMDQAEKSMKDGQIPIVVLHEKGMKHEDNYVVLRLKALPETQK